MKPIINIVIDSIIVLRIQENIFLFAGDPLKAPQGPPGICESHFESHCAYQFDIRMLLVLNTDFMAPKSARLKLSARGRSQISVLVCFCHYYFRLRQAACQWLTAQRWRISPPHSRMGSVSQHSYFHKAFIYRRWWMGSFFFKRWSRAVRPGEAERKLLRQVWAIYLCVSEYSYYYSKMSQELGWQGFDIQYPFHFLHFFRHNMGRHVLNSSVTLKMSPASPLTSKCDS